MLQQVKTFFYVNRKKWQAGALSFVLGFVLLLNLLSLLNWPLGIAQAEGRQPLAVGDMPTELTSKESQLNLSSALHTANNLQSMVIDWDHYTIKDQDDNNLDKILAMATDPNGQVWFGGFVPGSPGEGRLAWLDANGFMHPFPMPDNDNIEELVFDNNGDLWVATIAMGSNTGGAYRWDQGNQSWQHHDVGNNNVRTMAVDGEHIWFGTAGSGAYRLTPSSDTWLTYTTTINPGLCHDTIYKISVGDNGDVWFGTESGLCKLDTNLQWTTYLTGTQVTDLDFDSEGGVWVAAPSNGVYFRSSQGTWTNFTTSTTPPLNSNEGSTILVDSVDRKWIGSQGYGIDILSADNTGVRHLTIQNDLVDETVYDIIEDPQGHIWVGHHSPGSPHYAVASRGTTQISGLTATANSPVAINETTTLTATIEYGSGVTYTWRFGDGTPQATGITGTHAYQAAGSYTAVVTASNHLSQVTATTTILVGNPVLDLTITNSSPVYVNETTLFTATTSSGEPISYTWDFGNGTTIETPIGETSHAFTQLGVYTVTVVASNSGSSQSASIEITVSDPTDSADVTIAKNAPTFVEENEPFTYDITVRNRGELSATAIWVTDTLPTGVIYQNSDGNYDATTGTVSWQIPSLNPDEQRDFYVDVVVTASSGAGLINNATVMASNDDFVANNEASHTATVVPAVPRLNASASSSTFYLPSNQTETFTITVSNDGSVAANNLTILNSYSSWVTTPTPWPTTLNPATTLEAIYTINTNSIAEGRYKSNMTVTADNADPEAVPVTFLVGDFASDVTVTVTNTAQAAVPNAHITLVRSTPRAIYEDNVYTEDEVISYQAVTYFDGQVTLPYLPVGTYTMTVSATQHETVETLVTVTPQTTNLTASLTALPTLVFEPAMANVAVLAGDDDYIQVDVRNLGPGIANGFALDEVSLTESWMSAGLPANADSTTLLPGEALPVTIFLAPPAGLDPTTFENNYIAVQASGVQPAQLDLTIDVVNVATGTLMVNVLDDTTFSQTIPLAEADVTLVSQTPRTVQMGGGQSYQTMDWQVVQTDASGAVTVADLQAGEYNMYVESDGYYSYVNTVDVAPGEVNSALGINIATISLERDPFSFVWSVTEGTITDTYDVTITITTEEGQLPFPALFASTEMIDVGSQGANSAPPATEKGAGVLRVAQSFTDDGDWLIANVGWLPITNLELDPEFGDFVFNFDSSDIPETLEPGEAFTMPFSVSFSGNLDDQPCLGWLNISGSYQIPYLGWEWDIYRTRAPIYRVCPGQTGSWQWQHSNGTVTGTYTGGVPVLPPNAPSPPSRNRAQLILSGSAYLARQALFANLTLRANELLSGVSVDMLVQNDIGQSILGGFAVTPTLPTLLSQDGTINDEETVAQDWLLIPNGLGVTNPAGEQFTVRGVISYNGTTTQTTPTTVRIYPQPQIELKYSFTQPDIQNRFYVQVEAVNNGHGVARNLNLDLSNVTVLPDLDGNNEHLGYQLLETTIDGEVVTGNGYAFDFGDVPPNGSKTGRWQIQVTGGQGRMLVTGFSVACQHQDYQGLTLSPLIVNCGGQSQTYYTTDCPFCTLTGREVQVAGPINTYNGNHDFSQSTPSVSTVGNPLNVMWTYNSFSTGVPASGNVPYTSTLGLGWIHNHHMTLVVDPSMGSEGGVVIYAPKGTPMRFEETAMGYRSAPGIKATLERLPTGQPSTYTYTLTAHEQSLFVFNNEGQLVTRTDPQGNVTDYTYTNGLLARVEDRITGRGFDFAYYPDGRLHTVTDDIGRVTTFNYLNGLLSSVLDARQADWVYEYVDVSGIPLLERVIDPDGRVIEDTGYDSSGRATAQTYRGEQWTIAYLDPYRRVVTQGSGDESHTALLVYSSQGLILATGDFVNGDLEELAILSHDGQENLVYGQDKNGHVTSGSRTPDGYPTHMVNALDDVTLYDYDGRNNLTTFTDALMRTTTYEYDAQNNLITSTNATGGEKAYTYNAFGQVTSETDEEGRTSSYKYDVWGQLIVMTDTNNLVTSYGYDGVGRLITTTNPYGKVTVNEYDPVNHLVKVIDNVWSGQPQNYLDEYNIVTEYGYDRAGYRTVITDTMGRVNLTFYDDAGRVYLTVNNYDTVTPYSANPAQELCDYPLPANPSPEFNFCSLTEFDSAGRVVATTDNIGRINRTFYDAQGRVAGSVNNSVLVNTLSDLATCTQLPALRDTDACTTYTYDAMGNTLITTDTEGQQTYTVYDALNRSIATIRHWDGTDPQWLLANSATLPAERTENLLSQTAYDAVDNTLITTDTVGRMTYNVYDDLNRLQGTIQNWDGVTEPQTIIDTCPTLDPLREQNLCTVYTYNAAGQQLTSTNGLGQVSRHVYEPSGRLQTTIQNWDGTDPNTLIAQFNNGQLNSERTVNIFSLTEYDPVTGQRLASIDSLRQRTEYGYDSLGRLITTTRYLGLRPLETVSVYNALGNVTQRIDAAGQVVTTTYDSLNRVVNTISAEGVVVTTTYDALGRSIGTVDNLGHTTSTAYDGLGRVITSTNAAGDMTTQTYNIAGERLVQTDAEGVQTAYVYDDFGRQTHMIQNWDGTDVAQLVAAPVTIDPTTDVNLITRYTYDLQGNRLAVINARGYTATQTTYDSLNRAVMVQNALLTTTQTTVYNILGQTVVMTDANGAETHYSYDGLNRVESIFYATDNETVSYSYNVGGQKTVMTDSLGTTVYDYDDLKRLIKVTDPLSETVEYLYNDNGQREALVYPDGKVVSYTYDGDNRLATITDWSLGLFTFGYDSAGRHITTTLANGVVSLNGYDKANRLTSRTYTSAEGTLLGEYLYELDQVGNKITVTETILAPNVVREIEQFLEENGQLVLEAEAGEVTAGTAHSWESETTQTGYVGDGYLRAEPDTGARFAENDPAASTVSYRFQIDNPNDYALWLRGSATDASSDSVYVSVEGQGTSTALTGFGRAWGWANNDMSGEADTPVLLDLNSAGVYTLNLSLREDGVQVDRLLLITDTNTIPSGDGPPASVTQVMTETRAGEVISQVVTYAYDGLYRLEEAIYEGTLNATYRYDHDAVGNRTTYTQTVLSSGTSSTTVTTYQYDAANQLQVSVEDGVATTYQWDSASRLITTTVDGVVSRVYMYSQDGEMMQATVDGLVTTFAYNGVGQRLSLTVAGETTYYVLDYGSRVNRVLYEYSSQESKHYLYGGSCLAEFVTDTHTEETAWRHYLYDGNGYVRQTVDEQAKPTYAWTFSPEGAVLLGEEGVVSHLSCSGDAVYDWSTGLIFKNGNYYDPAQGIWISLGTVGIIIGLRQPKNRRERRRNRKLKTSSASYVWLLLLLVLMVLLTGCDSEPTEVPLVVCPEASTPVPTETPTIPPPLKTLNLNVVFTHGVDKSKWDVDLDYANHVFRQANVAIMEDSNVDIASGETSDILGSDNRLDTSSYLALTPEECLLVTSKDYHEKCNPTDMSLFLTPQPLDHTPRIANGNLTVFYVQNFDILVPVGGKALLNSGYPNLHPAVIINLAHHSPRTLPHELGHLFLGHGHPDDGKNFMAQSKDAVIDPEYDIWYDLMTPYQIGTIRNSSYVQ